MEQDFPDLGAADLIGAGSFNDLSFVEAVSPSMRAVEAVIRELGHSFVPVLLLGEHGAGKHAVARRIHYNSGGVDCAFQVKSCRSLSVEAFTVDAMSPGMTLYLEEIADLAQECQKKLLDLLSSQAMNGSSGKGVRVICGSSRDLDLSVREASFREDLYYQLSGVCLRIPPLRQRKEDVQHLMTFFLERYAQLFHRPAPALSSSTRKLFSEHSWPGNLDELASAMRTIVAVGDESVAMTGLRSILVRSERKGNGEKASLKEVARAASREAEKELILKVLTRTRWNRRRAAEELQISYKALLYKLKQIGYREYGA